jgi:SAM-dependent methyltransferase
MRLRRRSADGPHPGVVTPAPPILDAYVRRPPSPQVAVDVFEGEWASALPAELGVHAGSVPLFTDPRIDWIVQQVGGVDGRSVLELGPLEAGHTTMLERAGASVTAVESNTRAYLKCLIVKELVGLRSARFLLGDFLPFMETTDDRFDLVVASGVLYHAPDPLRLLAAIARVTDRVGIWTHVYDEAALAANPGEARRFVELPFTAEVAGATVVLHRRHYLESLHQQGFCGGSEESAVWMQLDGLRTALVALGLGRVEIGEVDMHHPHGPSVLLVATRD